MSADTLYFCNPPYLTLIRWRRASEFPPVHKAALILTPNEPGLIAGVGQAAPSALILVEVRPGQSLALADVEPLRQAGAAGFVITVQSNPHLPAVLVAARHAASRVQGEIGPRLGLMGYRLTATFEAWLEVLVGGELGWTAGDWTAALGESVRTVERRCAGSWRLPSPRRWLELVRTIHAVQALQARPDDSVESVLAAAGFRNVRRTRELVKRTCGAPTATVRRLIGWYWILESWSQTFWTFAERRSRELTPLLRRSQASRHLLDGPPRLGNAKLWPGASHGYCQGDATASPGR